MSIKGIDSQIMITRITDYQRDNSVQQKKNELMHDYLAAHIKAEDEKDKALVTGTLKTQEANVTLDNDTEGSGGGSSGGERKKQEEKLFEDPNKYLLEQLRTDDMYTIDIEV